MGKGKYWYNKPREVQVGITAVAAGSTTEVPVFAAPFKCKITKCSIIPASAITGADTNNMILKFINKGGDGSGTAAICSVTFANGTDASAFDEYDMGSLSNNILNKGDVVSFAKAENGNGMNMPDLIAKIEYIRI